MSRLLSVADYEREIQELAGLITRAENNLAENADFATEMELFSLQQRKAELEAEMRALGDEQMPGHEIDLIFNGKPVHENRLSAEFMGSVLLKVQNLITAMRAAERGTVATRGRFADRDRRESELRFAGSFTGSFGMRLESVDEQLDLIGAASLAPTLQALVALVEAGDNLDSVLSQIAQLDERSAKQYQDLVAELSNNEADIRLIWPNVSGLREASLRSAQASRLLVTLREVRERSSGQYYIGTLDIGNRRHGRFGFITDDGETFDGVVEEHLIDKLRDYYDRRCRAWIETREVQHQRTGIVKRSYRLQALEPLDAPGSR